MIDYKIIDKSISFYEKNGFSRVEDELGSYGIRSCEFLDWIYATGVAEPRFSSLINLKK